MWNLEEWYRSTGLQGRNRDRRREQTSGHQGGKAARGGGGGVMNWEIGIDIYTLICIKWITNKNLLQKQTNKIQKNPTRSHILGGRGQINKVCK